MPEQAPHDEPDRAVVAEFALLVRAHAAGRYGEASKCRRLLYKAGWVVAPRAPRRAPATPMLPGLATGGR